MDVRDNILLNLSDAGTEAVGHVQTDEDPASDSLFQDDFPPLTSVTEVRDEPSAETDALSRTSLLDTKETETSSTSAVPSQSTSHKQLKLIQKTLTDTSKTTASTKDSSNKKTISEKRKPSKTPEKEKLNKLKKFIHKK